MSLVLSPSIIDGGPSTISLNGNIVGTSDNAEETIFTEMGTP
jgi:hypothetical protein